VFRYCVASVVSYLVTLVLIAVTHGALGWSAFWSNIFSTGVATVPSYELNRKWAWGKSGRSHLWKEVVPFWVLAFIGLAFSTWFAVGAEHMAKSHHLSHLANTVAVEGGSLLAYALLWVGKFVFFNRILFAHHPEDLPPALDGRAGIPG
jgi:putative flippase GtrA